MAANEIFSDLNVVLQLNPHIQSLSVATNDVQQFSPVTASFPIVKQSSFKVLTDLESVSYSEAREEAQFDHQRSVFLSTSSSDLPYHLQGDNDFNKASAIARRQSLRFSDSIKTKIKFLWQVAGRKKQTEMAQRLRIEKVKEDEQGQSQQAQPSFLRRTAAGTEYHQLLPPFHVLDKEDYTTLMLLIFKVLRDDFVLELAHKQVQCDWEVDSQHGESLSFDQFFAAMFELADVWTCDMEETTYEHFIHLLGQRITRRVAVFLDGTELMLLDNFESEVVVKSIPLRTIPKFLSIARVVAILGMTTVGELAQADPTVVERERIDFIQRSNDSVVVSEERDMLKLRQDLQTLIAMFKSIALQFENSDYTLDDNVLRKVPNARGKQNTEVHETGVKTGISELDTSSLKQIPTNGATKDFAGIRDAQSLDVGTRPSFNDSGGGSPKRSSKSGNALKPSQIILDGAVRSSSKHTRGIDTTPPANTESSQANIDLVDRRTSLLETTPVTRSMSGSNASCFHPFNTIHDLQIAETSMIDALRSRCLIEKAIAIERQTECLAIRNELVKFGVDADTVNLSDTAACDRYNALYDLVVLRDGESLKSLAADLLKHIRYELSVYGIIVDDAEDIEDVYDGFYSSVMLGTGDSIVKDAQRWIEETARNKSVSGYIQQSYHELKSVDEVKKLDSNQEDEEFIALLTKETDAEDEMSATTNTSTEESHAFVVSMSPVVVTPQGIQSSSSDAKIESVIHSPLKTQGAMQVHNGADHEKRKKSKKEVERVAIGGADHTSADTRKKTKEIIEENVHVNAPVVLPKRTVSRVKEKLLHGGHQTNSSRKPKVAISTQPSDSQTSVVTESKKVDQSTSVGPPTKAADASVSTRPTMTLGHVRPNAGIKIESDEKEFHDTYEGHTARDALNIAAEFQEDETAPVLAEVRVDEERLEPRVPKIVVGGSSTATNVPVTGRYIQLLGLGTVLIAAMEQDFFRILGSHEGLDTDLVCFDIGTELDTALTKLQTLQRHIGNRVILFGGNADEPDRTQQIALDCLAHGALYFAMVPLDFPRLREKIISYFENSQTPYILRQRKPPGHAAHIRSSIGSGTLFTLHDEPRKASTSVAFAKNPRRRLAAANSALPALSYSPRDSSHPFSLRPSTSRQADFVPIAPKTPSSSQLGNRSPRFSTALHKRTR